MQSISTHSLTKRLTVSLWHPTTKHIISTHSLTKRLTFFAIFQETVIIHFNSQPHEEADSMRLFYQYCSIVISTHSLTKRLTIQVRISLPSTHISTHSLTKRLTAFIICNFLTNCISTHSLTKRLTSQGIYTRFPGTFQLTASRRG